MGVPEGNAHPLDSGQCHGGRLLPLMNSCSNSACGEARICGDRYAPAGGIRAKDVAAQVGGGPADNYLASGVTVRRSTRSHFHYLTVRPGDVEDHPRALDRGAPLHCACGHDHRFTAAVHALVQGNGVLECSGCRRRCRRGRARNGVARRSIGSVGGTAGAADAGGDRVLACLGGPRRGYCQSGSAGRARSHRQRGRQG